MPDGLSEDYTGTYAIYEYYEWGVGKGVRINKRIITSRNSLREAKDAADRFRGERASKPRKGERQLRVTVEDIREVVVYG